MKTQTQKESKQPQFYRFQVVQPNNDSPNSKPRSVGMAYLKDGQNMYTLRLWMFLNEKFYVIPNKQDSSQFLVLTRELNKNLEAKNKYFWNIVGNGKVDASIGYIKLKFDLFEKPILLSLYPESSATSASLNQNFSAELV